MTFLDVPHNPTVTSDDGVSRRPRISPRVEAAGLAALATLAIAATLIGLALTTLVLAGRAPVVAGILGWCARLASGLPWWMGLPASACLVALLLGVATVTLRYVRSRPAKGAPGVLVVDAEEPLVYSVGGRGGQIVASTGLLAKLTSVERRVVFAHEAAHLRLRHHRLLWLADVAALNPLLRPLRARLRFALERAADEEAVRKVGDRALVAKTVARVALLSFGEAPSQALGMNGSGVVDRVEALLAPAAVGAPTRAVVAAVGTVLVGTSLSLSQGPRLAELISHLCGI